MKKILVIILGLTAILATVTAGTFEDVWDGTGAEISSYRTVQPRYGQLRDAYTVLIFVPEHINRRTRVKIEPGQQAADADRLRVIKLNRVLRFTTGIYDYAVMTSVFTGLHAADGYRAMHPYKISISASEWCGNFYSHLLPEQNRARHVMHSYFGTEGDADDYLKTGTDVLYEDNLPTLIRELKGPFMETGTRRRITVIPALWESRLTHTPLAPVQGTISKKDGGQFTAGGTKYDSVIWTWTVGDRTVTYRTDAAYPHLILAWESSTGESGELIKSMYKPYWQLHGNDDTRLRRELGIAD